MDFHSNSQLHFQELDKKILTKEIQSRMHFGQFFGGRGSIKYDFFTLNIYTYVCHCNLI